MKPFSYDIARHTSTVSAEGGKFLAGGTNLIDHMKLGVEEPSLLIDVTRLPLDKIDSLPDGGLRIGATVRNSDLAYHQTVRSKYPALSQAILSGASPQIRNAATTAGNLLQRTRCYYFRDPSWPCNKRQPGSGCPAISGFNRIHAILGTSDQCIATHPSDMDVAMMAFDAVIRTQLAGEERMTPITDFYVAYGDDPAKENVLKPGELITAVELPATPWFERSLYLKVRDRASFEFALSSAAVALDLDGRKIRDIRIALGGVATKPWRATKAEQILRGQNLADDLFDAAAAEELKSAIPREHNAFKVALCRRTIVAAIRQTADLKMS